MSDDSKVASLEQHLLRLRKKMEEGFPGRAAELNEALEEFNQGKPDAQDRIRRLAHRLRGTAGSYGHVRLGEHAERVEALARKGDDPSEFVLATRELIVALGRSKADDAPALQEPQRPIPLRKTLAIDDDPSTRKLLELTLSAMGGWSARVLADPRDALIQLQHERFDLVIVDAMMPSMTGLEFVHALRGTEHGRSIPVAFLSAAAQAELGWELPDRTVWLRKPFRPRDLLLSLEGWMAE